MTAKLRLPTGTDVPVFVIHVKQGYEDRARHVEAHLGARGIPFEYMLDGDLADIDAARLERYFDGDMRRLTGATSCALKHLLVYEEILRRDLAGALVLEDDIFLEDGFLAVLAATLAEVEARGLAGAPLLLSYENSSLRLVAPGEVIPGQHLYERDRGRCAGAYWVNREAARSIVEDTRARRCRRPVDHYHNDLVARGALRIFWSHPAVAEQGSHNGRFGSALDHRRKGLLRRLKWAIQKLYKQNFRAYRRG